MRMMDFEGRTGAVAYVHQQIGSTLSHLDSKAYTYSGLSTAALVYLINREGLRLLVPAIDDPGVLSGFSMIEGFLAGFSLLSALFFVMTFIFCMLCLTPRSSDATESVVYFRGIASRKDAQAYASDIAALDEKDLAERLSLDSYYLARIAVSKLRYSSLAARFIFPGAAALVAAEVVRLISVLNVTG